jgi:peptidyl-prolyl cis-trans isomerase SurA
MKILKSLLIVLGLATIGLQAQDDRTLLTIAGDEVSVDEFMYVYKKNNTIGNEIDKKSLEEYLDLYINFRLKVKAAEEEGLDTVTAFREELAGYRKQLAEPYFTNEEIIDEMIQEAYERMKYDLRASHILIRVNPDAMPDDTLAAYMKILDARKRVESGEDFGEVAADLSEDPSARDRESQRNNTTIPGNKGDLGYFTVFDMVYPFETGAYNLEVGGISMPVRTNFGYHLIKLTDRIPAQGEIEAAHLYLKMPENASKEDSLALKNKADSLFNRMMEGEKFEDLVQEYSDDKGSASRGGMLPKFRVNRMVPEFIKAISMLEDSGAVSEPVLTSYGWHIIKLHSKTGIQPFDEVKEDLAKRIKKDSRSQKSQEVIINDIQKEYGYKKNDKALDKIYDIVDSTIYQGKWTVPSGMALNEVVFTLGEQVYNQEDFAAFIEENQNIGKDESKYEFINKKYKEYVDEMCLAYEDSRLEEKYPEFRAIVKEYRDGILLFELTNQKVWSFATQDTVGLQNYYEEHKKDFMWDQRLDASIYTVSDTSYLTTLRQLLEQGLSDDEVLKMINNDSLKVVKVERKKFEREDNDLIDSIKWKKGITENMNQGNKVVFVVVHEKIAPEPKSFSEARGLITAGYQEYLEEQWIKELRARYPYTINEEVLSSLVNK